MLIKGLIACMSVNIMGLEECFECLFVKSIYGHLILYAMETDKKIIIVTLVIMVVVDIMVIVVFMAIVFEI